jgi:hypothetical protein
MFSPSFSDFSFLILEFFGYLESGRILSKYEVASVIIGYSVMKTITNVPRKRE